MQYARSTRMCHYIWLDFAVCKAAFFFLAILTHNPLHRGKYITYVTVRHVNINKAERAQTSDSWLTEWQAPQRHMTAILSVVLNTTWALRLHTVNIWLILLLHKAERINESKCSLVFEWILLRTAESVPAQLELQNFTLRLRRSIRVQVQGPSVCN